MNNFLFKIKKITAVSITVIFTCNGLFADYQKSQFWADRRSALEHVDKKKAAPVQTAFLGASPVFGAAPLDRVIRSGFSNPPLISKPGVPPRLGKKMSKKVYRTLERVVQTLPTQNGSIRDISIPNGPVDNIVIHIQDIHQQYEAQKNIASTVRTLLENTRIDLVALEGAFGPLDFQRFHDFPKRGAIKIVSEDLLKNNRLSGPVFAGFTTSAPLVPYIGIDNPAAYEKNIDAYRRSRLTAPSDRRHLQERQAALEAEKKVVFSPALLQFDKMAAKYRNNTLTLDAFLLVLQKQKVHFPPALKTFHDALALEK